MAAIRPLMWCLRFTRQALRQEWAAIPISCLAALPSNIATCFLMELLAPLVLSWGLVEGQASGVALISTITPIIGYSTYLVAYYAGMLFKERRDYIKDGVLVRSEFSKKLQVVWVDFLAHLPSDLIVVIPLMGAAQGALSVAGLAQFWAIFWAQFTADCAYAIKEPIFWHGAKRFVAWRSSGPR